jgi:DNA topoisomerase I
MYWNKGAIVVPIRLITLIILAVAVVIVDATSSHCCRPMMLPVSGGRRSYYTTTATTTTIAMMKRTASSSSWIGTNMVSSFPTTTIPPISRRGRITFTPPPMYHHHPIHNSFASSSNIITTKMRTQQRTAIYFSTLVNSGSNSNSGSTSTTVAMHSSVASCETVETATTEPNEQHHLVIVESPAKCATIEKILNDASSSNNHYSGMKIHYTVTSCMGHIRNLPKRQTSNPKRGRSTKAVKQQDATAEKRMIIEHGETVSSHATFGESSSSKLFPYNVVGIDLDSGRYTPSYVIDEKKRSVVKDLQRAVLQADQVLLATDLDREGEAMAWHLADVLHLTPAGAATTSVGFKPYHRIRFTEITSQAILAAVGSTWDAPTATKLDKSGASIVSTTTINDNLVAAQETRRILDRLAGFTVSPVLWKKIAPGLSAGRVQSVGLQLIVAREQQRLAFQPTPFYDLRATLCPTTTSSKLSSSQLITRLLSINGTAVANAGKDFTAQGRKLTDTAKHKYHLVSESDALHWVDRMVHGSHDTVENKAASVWIVDTIKSTERVTKAPRPYKTSTLQQEAARRLGLPVQQTMRAAQQLYEAGCISYMRTDSTVLSQEAESAVESAVRTQFGANMVESPPSKKCNVNNKFAQEAHEAIRPAIQAGGEFLQPEQLPSTVYGAALEVYRMIYQRTLAHRMPPLITNQTQVTIRGVNGATEMIFRTSGRVVVSPGFTLAYQATLDSGDDGNDSDNDNDIASMQILPPLIQGQALQLTDLTAVDHTTQAPPRYSEASFVKELEALGVGRPSTYAGIVQTLRDRAYVGSPASANGSRRSNVKTWTGSAISAMRAAGGTEFVGNGSARGPLVPSLSAIVVCSLLERYCPSYVDPNFTARMEARLDQIASGSEESELSGEDRRIAYLDEFYAGESGLAAQIKNIDDTVLASDARRAILPALSEDGHDSDNDDAMGVGLFIGPWGPYIQQIFPDHVSETTENLLTAPLPPSMSADISTINPSTLRTLLSTKQDGGVLLGQHPDDGRNIRIKTGRFGVYLQWGEDKEVSMTSHSLPRRKATVRQEDSSPDCDDIDESEATLGSLFDVTLEEAVAYCGLPRVVSTFLDKPITAAIGPYGPYLKYDGKYLSLNAKDGDVLTIDATSAEILVEDGIINKKPRLGYGVIALLGEMEGKKVTVKTGRYGIYINWNKVNAKVPDAYLDNPETIPLVEAWSLIEAQQGPAKTGKKDSKSAKKDGHDKNLPPRPKRPLSSYLHFCATQRPKVSESVKTLGEISKKLALLWAETSPDDRLVYEQLAAKGKLQYEERIRAWEIECQSKSESSRPAEKSTKKKKLNGDNAIPKTKQTRSTSSQSKKTKGIDVVDGGVTASSSSVPRAPSAYMIFCRDNRPKMIDETTGTKLSFVETTQRLAALWRVCDEATKANYQQMAIAEKGQRNL